MSLSAEVDPPAQPTPGQHSVGRSILLHLLPGAALAAFVLVAIPATDSWDVDPLAIFFAGIGLVIVPIELGYLTFQGKKLTGRLSPIAAVSYRERLGRGRTLRLGAILALWFLVVLVISIAVVDTWLAENVFSWLPQVLLDFASVESGEDPSSGVLVLLLVLGFVFNGFVGPVTEELYFRGHLLPRIDRFGSKAPLINSVLFGIYHLWTPWRWPAIMIGFLPISWMVWRTRSVFVGIVAHVTINVVFLLLLLAAFLGDT